MASQQQQEQQQQGRNKHWFPLESNPDIMNNYIAKLGVKNTDQFCFTDVFGLDDELLMMVPQPVLAVLLLYPLTKESEEVNRTRDLSITENGQLVSKDLYFMKQTIGNACGTVGIIHAIANNSDQIQFDRDGFFSQFMNQSSSSDPAERAVLLERDDKVEVAHSESASEGSGNIDMDTNLHFVCFVQKDGHLYELDGRRPNPVNHGASSPATVLQDTVRVVKQYMEVNTSDALNWSLVALAQAA